MAAVSTLRSYQTGWLTRDAIAGLVLAAFLVPVGMGYAEASGLPAITGLYATIVPLIVYAIVGPSRILVLGPDSSLAPIIAKQFFAGLDPTSAFIFALLAFAAGFLVRNGPVTQQDRWEEDPGYSPFTAAAEIAGLLAAADLADAHGETAVAGYLHETADAWNSCIERWTYATGTALAQRVCQRQPA